MSSHLLASLPSRLVGWKFETPLPTEKKVVITAVPHTSNWDGVLLIALAQALGYQMSFMIKNDWVKGPMAPMMRRFGAIAIDRSKANNVVQQMIEEFRSCDRLALVVPPEGTRRRADYWKSGFYHIARGANVPVVPGYLDYKRKRAGMGPAIPLTGDVKADMDKLRAFYATQAPAPLYPEDFGPLRMREEGPPAP